MGGDTEELCVHVPWHSSDSQMWYGDQSQLCQAGTQGPQCPRDSQHRHVTLGAPSRACHHSLAVILRREPELQPSPEVQ